MNCVFSQHLAPMLHAAVFANSSPEIELIVASGRTLERIFTIAIGGLCVYFGFRLYAIVASSKASMEAGAKGFSVKLRDVGPGAIFAAIGCGLLAWAIFVRPQLDVSYGDSQSGAPAGEKPASESSRSRLVYSGALDAATTQRLSRDLQAINSALKLLAATGESQQDSKSATSKTFLDLQSTKIDLIRPHVGADDLATYLQFHPRDPSIAIPSPTEAQTDALQRIEAVLSLGDAK